MKWNESGFRPPLCTYRLNWTRRTSWGWWDDRDDTVLQTQDSKFEPWRSEAEHATSRSRRLPTILTFTRGWGRNIFVSFKPPRPGTDTRLMWNRQKNWYMLVTGHKYNTMTHCFFNAVPHINLAELFASIFYSFEAGMTILVEFPALNDEKYLYLWKILNIYQNFFTKFSDSRIRVKNNSRSSLLETFNECCFNFGPTYKKLSQHWHNIGWAFSDCLDLSMYVWQWASVTEKVVVLHPPPYARRYPRFSERVASWDHFKPGCASVSTCIRKL